MPVLGQRCEQLLPCGGWSSGGGEGGERSAAAAEQVGRLREALSLQAAVPAQLSCAAVGLPHAGLHFQKYLEFTGMAEHFLCQRGCILQLGHFQSHSFNVAGWNHCLHLCCARAQPGLVLQQELLLCVQSPCRYVRHLRIYMIIYLLFEMLQRKACHDFISVLAFTKTY